MEISPKRLRPVFPHGFQKYLKKLDLSGHGLTALVLSKDLEPGDIEELNLSNNPLTLPNLYLITRMDSLKKLICLVVVSQNFLLCFNVRKLKTLLSLTTL